MCDDSFRDCMPSRLIWWFLICLIPRFAKWKIVFIYLHVGTSGFISNLRQFTWIKVQQFTSREVQVRCRWFFSCTWSLCLWYCADYSQSLDFGCWRPTETMFDFSWRPVHIIWGANGCRPSEQSRASPSLHTSGVFVCPFARSVSALAPGEAHGGRAEERRQRHQLHQQPAEVGQVDAQQP